MHVSIMIMLSIIIFIGSGWGTYANDGIIYSSVAVTVQTISKLVTVVPQKSRYKPEIGDVVIGRVINVKE